MKFDVRGVKNGAGLRGAVAVFFLFVAGGVAFKLARRGGEPAPAPASESVAAASSSAPAPRATVAEVTPPAPAAPATAPTTSSSAGSSTAAAPKAGGPKGAAPLPAGFAKETAAPQATLAQADAAFGKGDEKGGILLLRTIAKARQPGPETPAAAERLGKIAATALEEASKAKAKDDPTAERAALTRAFFAILDREARKPIRARLDEVVKATIFGTRPSPEVDVYTVARGDKLTRIAQKHNTTWACIKRLNGLTSDSIRAGQKLRIARGNFELTVFKTDFLLIGTLDGKYLKAWDVGTGKEDRTPETTFKIAERIPNPDWYAPDGKVYGFGAKENILGTRWMGFERTPELSGFGIHGTAFPESIGTESSMGCIRMRNEDVEEVFDFTPKGCEVRIVR